MADIEPKAEVKQKKAPGVPFVKGKPGGPGRPKKTELDRIVDKAIESTKKAAIEYLESKALKAAERIENLGDKAKREDVQLSANKDILDRVGVGTKNTQVGVAVQVNFKDKEFE